MQHGLASIIIMIFTLVCIKKKKKGRNIVCQLQIRGSSGESLRKDVPGRKSGSAGERLRAVYMWAI